MDQKRWMNAQYRQQVNYLENELHIGLDVHIRVGEYFLALNLAF